MADTYKARLSSGFLDPGVFAQHAFFGQKSNLFAPEFAPLKQALMSILQSSHSAENLEFLDALQKLNDPKASPDKIKTELQTIEDTYIAAEAVSRMNIKSSTLDNILNSPDKSLANYAGAIKEVFDLISTNVTKQAKELVSIEKILVATKDLIEELDPMLPDKRASRVSLIFKRDKRDETLYLSCQNACKTAQQELRALMTTPVVSAAEHEKIFTQIILDTLPKLSAAFQGLKKYEGEHPDATNKSMAIQKIIDTVTDANKKVFGVDPVQRNRSSSKSSSQKKDEPDETPTAPRPRH